MFHVFNDLVKEVRLKPEGTKEEQDARSTQARNKHPTELAHLNVRDFHGQLWTGLRPALYLLVALAPFRGIIKFAYLRYHKPTDKKKDLASKFVSPDAGARGYSIPGYNFETLTPAYTTNTLPYIQAYYEKDMTMHPFVGASGIKQPELNGAISSGPEDWIDVLRNLETMELNTVDVITQVKFFAYMICFKFGPRDVLKKLNNYSKREILKVVAEGWDASDPKVYTSIAQAVNTVTENAGTGRRNMFLGLCSWISGLGLPQFHLLSPSDRQMGFRMLFKLARFQCCLAMFGPQMNKCLNIAQIFNPNMPHHQEECEIIREFLECRFVAECEALYEHNIVPGRFFVITDDAIKEIQAFYDNKFKMIHYMGRDAGNAFEELSILDMPMDSDGPANLAKRGQDTRMAASREPRSLDEIRPYYAQDNDSDNGDSDNNGNGDNGNGDNGNGDNGNGNNGNGDIDMQLEFDSNPDTDHVGNITPRRANNNTIRDGSITPRRSNTGTGHVGNITPRRGNNGLGNVGSFTPRRGGTSTNVNRRSLPVGHSRNGGMQGSRRTENGSATRTRPRSQLTESNVDVLQDDDDERDEDLAIWIAQQRDARARTRAMQFQDDERSESTTFQNRSTEGRSNRSGRRSNAANDSPLSRPRYGL